MMVGDTYTNANPNESRKTMSILNDPPQTFFSDHCIVLVVGIVGISELAIGPKLEFKKLVAKLAHMTDTKRTWTIAFSKTRYEVNHMDKVQQTAHRGTY